MDSIETGSLNILLRHLSVAFKRRFICTGNQLLTTIIVQQIYSRYIHTIDEWPDANMCA